MKNLAITVFLSLLTFHCTAQNKYEAAISKSNVIITGTQLNDFLAASVAPYGILHSRIDVLVQHIYLVGDSSAKPDPGFHTYDTLYLEVNTVDDMIPDSMFFNKDAFMCYALKGSKEKGYSLFAAFEMNNWQENMIRYCEENYFLFYRMNFTQVLYDTLTVSREGAEKKAIQKSRYYTDHIVVLQDSQNLEWVFVISKNASLCLACHAGQRKRKVETIRVSAVTGEIVSVKRVKHIFTPHGPKF